jgi:hypothetical protein
MEFLGTLLLIGKPYSPGLELDSPTYNGEQFFQLEKRKSSYMETRLDCLYTPYIVARQFCRYAQAAKPS